ncbi:hypothetical protein PoB_006168800 [Plakobranchus ocellatus]|uniref:Uncharacterized protein n=1 Tax=Plakobranchus ocellatus TaxID=259542 RepID=A0AAV4CTL2_9GAST|nr:hypothetical protein PoB_006168800 [Plakobranchus ocellatus]
MFQQYCIDNDTHFPPEKWESQACVANFLNQRAELSERPESLLKTITAALKHYFKAIDQNFNWESIESFVKALIKANTKRPAGRTKVMPIQSFMNLFESWGPNRDLCLKKLRQKAITLLALAEMCRFSDLALRVGLFRNQVLFKPNGCLVVQFFGTKNDSDRHGFEVQIDPSSNPLTDPVSCLREYIEKT